MNGSVLLLFDWEDVLVHGPFMERLASSASLRLSVPRRDLEAALAELDEMSLRNGEVSLAQLAHHLADELEREITPEELMAVLQESVIYQLDGLAALGRFAARGQAAVVGGSHPGVPERLRKDLLHLIPPERHVYAHEAGHPVSDSQFFPAAAEALQVDLESLFLVTRRENVLLAAKQAGCGAIQYEGPDTHFDIPDPEDEEPREVLPETPEDRPVA